MFRRHVSLFTCTHWEEREARLTEIGSSHHVNTVLFLFCSFEITKKMKMDSQTPKKQHKARLGRGQDRSSWEKARGTGREERLQPAAWS